MIPTAIWIALALLLLLDGLRLRGRVRSLPVLEPSDEPAGGDHIVVSVAGLVVPDAVVRAASHHARRRELDLLDLVPHASGALDVMGLCQIVDPATWGTDRLASGRTAAQAVLVSRRVLERAGVAEPRALDSEAFVRFVSRLKRYASDTAAIVVAPGMPCRPMPWRARRAVLDAVIGGAAGAVLLVQAVVLAALVGIAWQWRPWGALPLAAFWLQPMLAVAGTGRLATGCWLVATALRPPLEVGRLLVLAFGPASKDHARAVAERRPKYAELLAAGTSRFFEPRLERCPICDGGELARLLSTPDLVQHKPGRFTLERCAGCGHVFQNPRLSLEGLSFYYSDAYDGLGEESTEMIFAASPSAYLERARLVHAVAKPRRWLDVGCGHGHFSAVAKQVLGADVELDGLDLSESVEDAERRGWIGRAYRGLFPDVAPGIAGRYDVVSMHHYLEHTLDPAAEIRAAAVALEDGGHLLIELPDPSSVLGRLLGRFWLPFFQPQHLHLLSVENLTRLLQREGFEPVRVQRGEAHIPVDFLGAATLFLGMIAPPVDSPWTAPTGVVGRAWSKLVWLSGMPLMLAARIVDTLIGPVTRRTGVSNAFRLVAVRRGAALRTPTGVDRGAAAGPVSNRAALAAE